MKLEVGKEYRRIENQAGYITVKYAGNDWFFGETENGTENIFTLDAMWVLKPEPALDDTLMEEVEKVCLEEFGTHIRSRQIMALIKVLEVKLQALGSIRRED